ncbi:hypothetical protein [Neglectibacter caecimuris]|uniref:hypothetical protein n=1 Tax=Neglectibacter caecimuris TaxID=3093658 RepID=UPI002AC9A139|nr:hypothetical protein [Neglectibacter sp. M00184]
MPTITDWLMVAITAVYVIATILICRANIKSAKATKEQIEESKRQFEESNRAFVTVSFDVIRSGLAVLRIQNVGKRIANHVRVHIAKAFMNNVHDKAGKEYLERLCSSSFTIGIGQCWYICIGSHLQLKEMSKELLSIELSYEDSYSRYTENIEIDLKEYFWALMYESPTEDAYQEMKKQTRELEKLCKEVTLLRKYGEQENKNA